MSIHIYVSSVQNGLHGHFHRLLGLCKMDDDVEVDDGDGDDFSTDF